MESLNKAITPNVNDYFKVMNKRDVNLLDNSRKLAYQIPAAHFMTPDFAQKHNVQRSIDAFEQTVLHPKVEMRTAPMQSSGASDKIAMTNGQHTFIMKPFYDNLGGPLSNGAAELMSRSLYHSAGIGHLHQKVFLVSTDKGDYVVIHAAQGHIPAGMYISGIHKHTGEHNVHKRIGDHLKISLMDHLLGNADRHSNNMLIGPEDHPLAIDNSYLFSANHGSMERLEGDSPGSILGQALNSKKNVNYGDPLHKRLLKSYPTEVLKVANWWNDSKDEIKKTFEHHLTSMHPAGAQNLRAVFDLKHQQITDHMNNIAKGKFDASVHDRAIPDDVRWAIDKPIDSATIPKGTAPERKFIPLHQIGPVGDENGTT